MQSTSYEMLGWMNHKLESRLQGEISVASDMQMTPPLWQKAKRKMPNRRGTSLSSNRYYFLWLQNHCEQWLQPWNWKMLAPWKKGMTNLDSIFKTRDVTLLATFHRVKAMVFPVVMYGCESWTRKKAEHQKIDAFELWCCRRLLRVPWTAKRSN